MSEWKNRVKKPISDEYYCTGWSMADGFIQIINILKKSVKKEKQKKIKFLK